MDNVVIDLSKAQTNKPGVNFMQVGPHMPNQSQTVTAGGTTTGGWAQGTPFVPVGNPKFNAALALMKSMHDKKSKDYASDADRYSNFKNAAITAGVDVDAVFRTMLGIKLARLSELQASGKTPNNESVYDSILDTAVYATLWLSYHTEVK